MLKSIIVLLPVFTALLFSCADEKAQKPTENIVQKVDSNYVKVFDTKPADITADFSTWYNYTYFNIKLSQDFVALDIDSVEISKGDFLKKLQTGKLIPIKVLEKNGAPYYRLFSLKNIDAAIARTMKQIADNELEHVKWIGKALPAYNWTDLDGASYNKDNSKGKLVVIKCWFINCVACVKEFPELNELVEKNKDKKDVVFISLATDATMELKDFLSKRPFKYAVVPEQGQYMEDELKINAYPTHILVGKDGKIMHVSYSASDLIWALNKEWAKGF